MMKGTTLAAILIIGPILVANAIATHRVIANCGAEFRHIFLQAALIWLLPGIGAAIVFAVLREPKSNRSGTYPVNSGLDVDPYVGVRNATHDYFQDE